MVNVNSEIGQLLKVIIHRPDEGIARISPKRAEELLFDDIVHLPTMQKEHDIFVRVLKAFMPEENILEVETLIFEALKTGMSSRKDLLDKITEYEDLPFVFIEELMAMTDEQLTKTLITGYDEVTDNIYFDPIPNFIFTRDIAVSVKDHIIITKAAKEARYRENLLTRFIFYYHPDFAHMIAEDKIINLNDLDRFPPSRNGDVVSIEGGDIMMVGNDYLLIGCSERTSDHAIKSLSKVVFEKGVIDNVAQINIPADRTCMHIDTIFTRISEKDVVAYKPIIYDGVSSNVIVNRKNGEETIYDSVKSFFLNEINPEMNFIFSGMGVSPYQEREQWTDGCNLVALKPGVGITYDRNPKTEQAFKEAGYTVVEAEKLLAEIDRGLILAENIKSTIITIPSSELSRARGGSHCMTCPIERTRI